MNTTTQIDLTPFCDPDGEYLATPWVKDGWRYATDGRVCVRVLADGEPNEPPLLKRALPSVAQMFSAVDGEWLIWPAIPPCNLCHGKSAALVNCSNCRGSGRCECADCGCQHECAECDGDGQSEQTCECHSDESRDILCGAAWVRGYLAERIGALPHVSYLPQTDSGKPVRFRFDGGDGLVMPLMKEQVGRRPWRC